MVWSTASVLNLPRFPTVKSFSRTPKEVDEATSNSDYSSGRLNLNRKLSWNKHGELDKMPSEEVSG